MPLDIGGSKSTSNQTTLTATSTLNAGSGSLVAKGEKALAVGSGSISVNGAAAKYVEAGATDLAGATGQLGGINLKGAKNVTISYPTSTGGGSSTADASIAALTDALKSTTSTAAANATAAANNAATSAASLSASSPGTQSSPGIGTQIANWFRALGLSDWQIAGGVAVVALVGWLIFHKRKRA